MTWKPRKYPIIRSEQGATIVEFAFVAPVFLLLLLGLFDLGYSVYMQSALTGAVQNAARSSALETGSSALATIDEAVETHVRKINPHATITFERQSYFDYEKVNQPEVFTDGNGNGSYDSGECFEDINQNGSWDEDVGDNGVGGPNDVVLYSVSASYDRIFPFWKLMSWDQENILTASTVLKNQPYGDQLESSMQVICT